MVGLKKEMHPEDVYQIRKVVIRIIQDKQFKLKTGR
jgi:hypothetical protein